MSGDWDLYRVEAGLSQPNQTKPHTCNSPPGEERVYSFCFWFGSNDTFYKHALPPLKNKKTRPEEKKNMYFVETEKNSNKKKDNKERDAICSLSPSLS